ncbi:MAG: hypothetical protein DM484_27915 [Candidatus Methylumidiphilus alinenensis]|uniref:PEP-CTERM sorting domain-containing protein n=1 Tax=Candidatus Methylumidiphilus alinenensis TaxID=2202197 RepID=A0A2W4SAH1_9GAMM|nr:MAG: hypothetical protein DM484_27915 [Candidatus Methylumidiphilus alinenensis]
MNYLLKTTLIFNLMLFFFYESATAAPIVLNLDSLPGMSFWCCSAIPSANQLSTQFLPTDGVSFTSGSSYAAIVDLGLGHATTGTNGIGGSTPTGILTYDRENPITATFFSPSNPSVNAVTNFVSLRGDNYGSGLNVTLNAYGLTGNLLASYTTVDVGGETLSISVQGIHSVQFLGTHDNGGVVIDEFTFNKVTSTPIPAAAIFVAPALAGVFGISRRKRSKTGQGVSNS